MKQGMGMEGPQNTSPVAPQETETTQHQLAEQRIEETKGKDTLSNEPEKKGFLSKIGKTIQGLATSAVTSVKENTVELMTGNRNYTKEQVLSELKKQGRLSNFNNMSPEKQEKFIAFKQTRKEDPVWNEITENYEYKSRGNSASIAP